MGLHRDGVKWDLDSEVVQQRRYTSAWTSLTTGGCSGNVKPRMCFKPIVSLDREPSILGGVLIYGSSLWPGSYDTAYPDEPDDDEIEPNQKGFFTLKFELSRISCSYA
jgi:hypothetical protein